MVVTKIATTNKKHSRLSPDVQFKEFSLIKEKRDLARTVSKLGKPFLKNQIKNKKTENQCQNAACEQKTTSEKWKSGSNKILGPEGTMNGLQKN